MHRLEQHYSGDKDWQDFVKLYDEFWDGNQNQIKLLNKLNKHIDLAKVINGKIGNNSLNIIDQKIPALDNISIIDCLNNPELIKRLKVCLKRMP